MKPMTPEEFREYILRNFAYMEGLSYAMSEEAGKQLRVRLANSQLLVKALLENHFTTEVGTSHELTDDQSNRG